MKNLLKNCINGELFFALFFVFVSGVIIYISSAKSASKISQKAAAHLATQNLRQIYSNRDSTKWEAPHIDQSVLEDFAKELGLPDASSEENRSKILSHLELRPLPLTPPYPQENPYTKEKADLGKKLFNDPRLSLSNQIACASCHDKELGFADNKSVSYGHDRAQGNRNSPSVVMSAFGTHKFWDGRANSLESQVLFPIADPKEMAFSADKAAKKLNKIKEYKDDFYVAFGTRKITKELLSQAIATYERSLMPHHNRFDRFLNGKAEDLSDEEVLGLHLFRTKARCMNCHNGVALSDDRFHNLGLHYYGRERYEDLGRYEITRENSDVGKFKTPSLRSVKKTAPYMHNGLFPHLRGVLNAYNAGMANPIPKEGATYNPPFPSPDELLKKLELSEDELNALEAFLNVL